MGDVEAEPLEPGRSSAPAIGTDSSEIALARRRSGGAISNSSSASGDRVAGRRAAGRPGSRAGRPPRPRRSPVSSEVNEVEARDRLAAAKQRQVPVRRSTAAQGRGQDPARGRRPFEPIGAGEPGVEAVGAQSRGAAVCACSSARLRRRAADAGAASSAAAQASQPGSAAVRAPVKLRVNLARFGTGGRVAPGHRAGCENPRGCGCWRSTTSATPAPGCSPTPSPPPAASSTSGFSPRPTSRPADPAGYDAVMTFGGAMHVDQEPIASPGSPPSGRCSPSCSSAGPRCSRVCLGAQLLSEAAGGDARRARAGDRLARGRGHRGRGLRSAARPAGAALRGLRMAQLRVRAARGGDRPRAHPGLRPGLPHRRRRVGDPVSRRGQPSPTSQTWIAVPDPTPTPCASASIPSGSGGDAATHGGLERARPRALRALSRRRRRAARPPSATSSSSR